MTNPNRTDITIILDESSSMNSCKNETFSGFNEFLATQAQQPGEAFVSLYTFADESRCRFSAQPIATAPRLSVDNYNPFGMTALLDALGDAITDTGRRLAAMREVDRPGKVIMVVITDGEENRSSRHAAPDVQSMISHQRDAYKWEFVFLGADQDAITNATSVGIKTSGNVLRYVAGAGGTRQAWNDLSRGTTRYRAQAGSLSVDFFGKQADDDPAAKPTGTTDQNTHGLKMPT